MSKFFSRWIIGQKPNSKTGSNLRRLLSRAFVCFSLILLLGSYFSYPIDKASNKVFAYIPILFSILYFFIVVAAIPFLTSQGFRPNAPRLAIDALISTFITIAAFAYYYMTFGIEPPDGEHAIAWSDYIYFSAVTFSTLGFGDFRPSEASRLMSALQAILGNLHLGMIVGAAFFAATND